MSNRAQKSIIISLLIVLTMIAMMSEWTTDLNISRIVISPNQADYLEDNGAIYFNLKVTAYSSEPSQTDSTPFEAAWGHRVHKGIVAVSRDLEAIGLTRGLVRMDLTDKLVWFYPVVEIDGVRYTVKDRMNRRKRKQFDIWMESKETALAWGVQYRTVKVIYCSRLVTFDLIRFDNLFCLADINQGFT